MKEYGLQYEPSTILPLGAHTEKSSTEEGKPK